MTRLLARLRCVVAFGDSSIRQRWLVRVAREGPLPRRPSPARCSGPSATRAGSAMPGATVTITETRTNISLNTVTNDAGFYTFPSLKDGTYRVVAELAGFKKVLRDGVIVPVNTTIRVDLAHGGRHPRGVDHRRRFDPDPPDRSHRHRTDPRVEDRHRHAAHLQPQLPEHADPGAGRDAAAAPALGVLQLAGLARRRSQRPAAPGEQHADRGARQQPQDRPAAGDHPGRRRARNGQRVDEQLRRGVRPLRRRRHERDAQVRHQPAEGQRLHLRQHRRDQRERLLHPPEGADQVSQHRLHRRRSDRSQQVLLLRRLSADDRRLRLRRARHGADDGDAQRRLQRGVAAHLRSVHRRSRHRQQPDAFRQQRDPAGSHQPNRAPAAAVRSRTEHRRRAARPAELPAGADAREDHRRLRREAELQRERERPVVLPPELHAAGRLRSGCIRRVRRAGQRRLRRHRHEQEHQHRGDVDADVDQHHAARRPRRPELLPQRRAGAGRRPQYEHRRRHSGREPRRRTPAASPGSKSAATPIRCSGSRRACRGTAPRRRGTSRPR